MRITIVSDTRFKGLPLWKGLLFLFIRGRFLINPDSGRLYKRKTFFKTTFLREIPTELLERKSPQVAAFLRSLSENEGEACDCPACTRRRQIEDDRTPRA